MKGCIWVGAALALLLSASQVRGDSKDRIWERPAFSAEPAAIARAAAALPLPNDADLEMFFIDTHYRLHAEGRIEWTDHRIYRYLTRRGVDDSSYVEIPWSPWYEDRPTVRARVITADGKEHQLDPQLLAEVPVQGNSPQMWSDQRTLRAPLPATDVGTVVEVELAVRETKSLFAPGVFHRYVLGGISPVHKTRLTIDAPRDIPVHWLPRGTDLTPQRSEHDGRVALLFETEPKRWKVPESYLPPDRPRLPEIAFTTGKSWNDIAAGYAAMVDKQLEKAGVESLVHEEIGGEKDRNKIAAKLLAAVHRMVRYTGVEFGDAGIVPRQPREVLVRRFGDCKDQSALLVAMLRAAGMHADVVLLRAGAISDVIPELPGLGNFNHAIVSMGDDPPLWIDPTAHYVAVGRLPTGDQGRWALVARRDSAQLVRTPVQPYRQTARNEVCEVFPDGHGRGVAQVSISMSGSFAEGFRDFYASSNRGDLRKFWDDYCQATFHSRKLQHCGYVNLDDLDKPFQVLLEIHDAEIGKSQGADLNVKLDITRLLAELPAEFNSGLSRRSAAAEGESSSSSKRVAPMLLPEPHVHQLTYRVVAPPTCTATTLPSSSVRRFGPVSITQEFTRVASNEVRATFRLDTGPGLLAPADVDALRAGLREMITDEDNVRWEVNLVFRDMLSEYLSHNQIKELLTEARQLIHTHPDRQDVRRTYMSALLCAGMGEAAQKEARALAAANPKSALYQSLLASALCYDPLGRFLSPGMDRDGALVAFRKSLEIDPDQGNVRAQYGELLRYGSDGLIASPSAKLDEAITEMKHARRHLDNPTAAETKKLALALEKELAEGLFTAGRYAELRTLASEAKQPITWQSLLVAAAADESGVQQAQRQAVEMCRDMSQRSLLLVSAAFYLEQSRRYAPSVALAETLATDNNPASQLQKYVESLRHLRKVEINLDRPIDNPSQLVNTYLAAVQLGGQTNRDVGRLFIEGTTPDDLDLARDRAAWGVRPLLEECRLRKTPTSYVADRLSLLSGRIEGNDSLGYRVRITEGLSMYAMLEDRVYRMVEPGPQQSNLGEIAMRCLEQRNPMAAQLWLDWALAEQPLASPPIDPFASTPFAWLWSDLRQDDPENMRLAAAALLVEHPQPRDVTPILLEGRGLSHSGVQALQVERALAVAYDHADHWEEALDLVERMLINHPGVPELIAQRISALWQLGRSRGELVWLREQVRKMNTSSAQEYLAMLSARVGDFQNANQTLGRLATLGQISPAGLNSFAWNSIFLRNATQSGLDAAAKASDRFKNEQPSYLHTLASMYAELGRNAEALKTLQRCVAMRGNRITDGDWYVLGRIADNYGLNDVAADLYRKVTVPKRRWADDVYQLAQWRLKVVSSSVWEHLSAAAGPCIDELPTGKQAKTPSP